MTKYPEVITKEVLEQFPDVQNATIRQIIAESEVVGNTPGGGNSFYHNKNDIAIIEYPNCIKVYSERILNTNEKYACCFKKCAIIEKQSLY